MDSLYFPQGKGLLVLYNKVRKLGSPPSLRRAPFSFLAVVEKWRLKVIVGGWVNEWSLQGLPWQTVGGALRNY